MDCMELQIYRRGAAVGTLRSEDDGLYRILSAQILPAPELLRLFLHGRSFGVFAPEGDFLALRRRVSRTELPTLPERAFAWCPSDGVWVPDGGSMIRHTPEGPERAIRWRTDGPMDFPAAPGLLRPVRLADGYYLYLPSEINR